MIKPNISGLIESQEPCPICGAPVYQFLIRLTLGFKKYEGFGEEKSDEQLIHDAHLSYYLDHANVRSVPSNSHKEE